MTIYQSVAIVLVVLAALAAPATASPMRAAAESSPSSKNNHAKYMTSTVSRRSSHARPPACDQAKTTRFLTSARWAPRQHSRWRAPREPPGLSGPSRETPSHSPRMES